MIVRLAVQVLLVFGSAFFAGSETALFSLSRLDLQQLRRQQHPRSATLHALLDQPRRLIISILCGNELVRIAAVANMTAILVSLYGAEKAAVISIVVMVPVLLLLGEITPKTIAVANPVAVSARLIAAPMSLWVRAIAPLRWVLRGIADRVTSWIVGPEKAPENILQLDEFRSIVDEVASEGELHDTERTLIYQILDAGATEIDEFGGVEGIVTLRDVLTFIFGHLSGEVSGFAARLAGVHSSAARRTC
jgi:Mg2+/Co2+ transporter CorB